MSFDLYLPEPHQPVPGLTGRCQVRIFGRIDCATVARVAETLAKAPLAEHLVIDIDSPGGELCAAFDAFILLDRHPAARKIAWGAHVGSAALLPLMAGDERIARAGARALLHMLAVEPAAGSRWNARQHAEAASDLEYFDDQYAKIIAARTGAPIEVISQEMQDEEPSTLDWCLRNRIFTRTLN